MILNAASIRERQRVSPIFSPFVERTVHKSGLSGGLSLAGYDVHVAQDILLVPGEFALASTTEHFDMPLDLLARVTDKSTHARRGLSVFNTTIEPGWEGFLTLELKNQNHAQEIEIREGTPIAQILFHLLTGPTPGYTGKYQYQGAAPVSARLEALSDTACDGRD